MSKYTYSDFFTQFPEVYQRFHSIVDHSSNYLQDLSERGLLNGVRSVLSIGAGQGALELYLASQYGVKLGYIDPTPQFAKIYQEKLDEQKLRSYACETVVGSFEEYTSDMLYDLVISIHSWYAFGRDRALLEKALSSLKPGGQCFITIVSHDSVAWKLAQLGSSADNTADAAEGLSKWAQDIGCWHDYYINHRYIAYERLVQDGQLTEDGKSLSLLHLKSWEELSQEIQAGFVEVLSDSAHDGLVDFQCGCLVFSA